MTEQEKNKEKKVTQIKKQTTKKVNPELEAKIEELNDKYLRLYSEFDNFRKRTHRERIEFSKTASAEVITNLLPVLDDFERAIRISEQSDNIEPIREGEKLIFNKLKTILQQKGLSEIKSVGEIFNTDLHDAITNIPAPTEDMKGRIIDETEKGYMLNGKVIRFAKVVVGQ
jgi:molecular chaperone GrpE